MTTFICLLRGINIGGKRIVKMESLRALFVSAGTQNVRTYIQSGNVIFDFAGSELPVDFEQEVSKKMEVTFGFSVPLLFMKDSDLERILAHNSFAQEPLLDASFFHVTIFKEKLPIAAFESYETAHLLPIASGQPAEGVVLTSNCAYLYCPNGYQNFKGGNGYWERLTGIPATTRNWKTLQQLVAMGNQSKG